MTPHVPEGQAFAKDIDRQLAWLARPRPSTLRKWVSLPGLAMAVFLLIVVIAFVALPNRFFDPEVRTIVLTLGALAIWRYSWWFCHALRSERFARRVYPALRSAADDVWAAGWRPDTVHVMMTTYNEKPEITRKVVGAVLDEIAATGVAGQVWIGTGSEFDEDVVTEYVKGRTDTCGTTVTFVRQNQPGKRMAIGAVLRAIRRSGAGERDLVVFMDGDSVLMPGVLRRAASLFGADPKLDALTTDEEVICYGPGWMQRWLKMRFAQRRVAMQSHALSGKVLTLTGRMSVFRGYHVLTPRFIRMVEADHLDHWLWGRFRFLSGDDKSTWYYLLSQSARMLYVPDATVATIEVIEGSGKDRMVANLRRWSGNMLRNGARAIGLGPRKVGPFIWWCLVDQRIAMFTTIVSPVLAIYGSIMAPGFMITAILWILATRIILSLFLFRWSREIDPTWPVLLYVNQILNACVKIFISSRLAQQSWVNRGNQRVFPGVGLSNRVRGWVANMQVTTTVAGFLWVLALWSGLVTIP